MEDKEKELPNFQTDYQKCSWYSDIFYTWATDFIMHIYNRKTLERVDQCIQMAEKDSSNSLCDRLTNNLNDMNKDGKFAYRWGIIYLVIKTLKWDVFSTLLYGFLAEFLQVTNLFVISFYIRWIQDDDREKWLGFFLSFFIAIVAFVSLVIRHKFFFFAGVTGLNMRKSITALIFKKILRFNQKSLAKASTGKIVTIVSGELQMVEQGLIMAPYIVIAPFATIYAFSLIAIDFGEAAAIGFAMFIIIIICQALISRATVRWKYWEGVYSDRRMKVIGDIVNGIRTIK